MTKNNFIFYADYMEDLQELDPVDFRTLLLAMTCYQTGEDLPEMGVTLKCLFRVLCRRIDYDNESYENTCTRNRENGSKGGRPKKNAIPKNKENPTKPKETQENPEKPKHNPAKPKKPDIDMDIDIDMDLITSSAEADAVIREQQQPLPELNGYTSGIIKDVWNASSVTLNVEDIPLFGLRANNTRLCIGRDFGAFIGLIKDLENHYWLQEMAKQGHPIDYDWFVDPDRYLKIREGKYKEKHKNMQHIEGAWTDDGLEFGW